MKAAWRRVAAIVRVLALAALAVAYSAQVMADDRAVQASAIIGNCQGCHGIPGYRNAFPVVYPVPKLGGQESAYLVKALQDYRSGARKHATMQSIAASLTDQEIEAIAAYYAGTGSGADEPTTTGNPDTACVGCHGPGGNKPVSPQTPRLAGQLHDYLAEALKQYRSGARPDPIMGAMAKGLSDAEIQALARYYSTQPGLTVKY